MRIAFLFNHDQLHQVAHSLPIALALARRPDFTGEIIIATTSEAMATEVLRLGAPLVGTRIQHVHLALKPSSRRIARLLGSIAPAAKVLVYKDNLDFFRSLDVMVVAEKTSLILRRAHGLTRPLLVHTRHGAGDRAIGFDKHSAGFDHVLCSGEKIRQRLIRDAGVPAEDISVVGYPKFDIAQPTVQLMHNAARKPVVLYNPHPSPHLSSWYRHGRAVLDYFVDNEDYQLIFAPHVMLFQRRFVISIDKLRIDRPGKLDARYLRSPNIHIDLGSRASTDMTYTQGADIYLGDVSSQVYEFAATPRPCVFLDAHAARWQDNPDYLMWRMGEVVDTKARILPALRDAFARHRQYIDVQRALVTAALGDTGPAAPERAAQFILEEIARVAK